MENSFEKGPEKILTKEEVLEVIRGLAENAKVVRELSDDKGLYLLEAEIEGQEAGEVAQYQYIREGKYPDGNQSQGTVIHVIYYMGGIPCGGHNVADYDIQAQKWNFVE